MTVGRYAGMALQGSAECNGAVFLLHSGPIQDAEVELDGWTVRVTSGVKAVVAYGSAGPRTFSETYDAALTAANNALDYMSARGLCDVQIRDAYDDCLVWWPDDKGIVIRANVILTQTMHSSAKAVAFDADGNVIPPVLPKATKHDAFRFIRMSRTSEYLFDAYRNMFLAFEAVLSDIYPQPKGMREGEWFKAALRKADGLAPVASLAPSGVASPVEWVYDNIYADARSGLMHAKQGRPYHLPQDDRGRRQLQSSLNSLWLYISQLLDTHLGVRHMAGGLMQGGFKGLAEAFLSGMSIAVSADTTPVTPQDDLFAPAGNPVVTLVAGSVSVPEPFLATVLASCDATDIADPRTIGRIGSIDKATGNPLILSALPGPLELGDSVKRLEVMLGFRGLNATGPRTHFSA
ncbi:hypothetical protein ACWEJS_06685 [Rhodococcus triatomae]